MLARAPEDPEELRSILAEDVEWEVGAMDILGAHESYAGPDGVLEFFRHWVSAFGEWGYQFDDVIEEGDCVIAHIHQWGIGRASGVRVDNDFWQVWKLRDGKAVRGTNHRTREDALAAARR